MSPSRDRRSMWPRWLLALLLVLAGGCSAASSSADGAPSDASVADVHDAVAGEAPRPDLVAANDKGPVADGAVAHCDPYAGRDPDPEVLIGPTGLEQKLAGLIGGAEQKLYLMMYQLTRWDLRDALIAAHQRGVEVKVLLDGEQEANDDARAKLQAAGVAVKDAPAIFSHFHAKVLWIDGELAVVMSANMNSYSMSSERNYGVIDRDAQDLAQLERIFLRDWAGSGQLDLSCSRLIVSPINARERLLALINGAGRRLELAVMYISDGEVRDAVAARAKAGVTVRVLLANPGWIDGNVETAKELVAAGAKVGYLMTPELHAKLIVADGVAFVGSQNLSYTALGKNREVGLLVSDEAPAKRIADRFEADWAIGVAP